MPSKNNRQAPKEINLSTAYLERKEDKAIRCKTCNSPAHIEYEPYCMNCGLYWKDCENGLFN